MEERHFIEVVTHFKNRQKVTGKNHSVQLRAELRRFGYLAQKGGLQIIVDVMDDPDDQGINDYATTITRQLLNRISGEARRGSREGDVL